MKHILIALLLLLSLSTMAQTTVLKIGTSGYVTIDGNNYPRGQVYTYYQVNVKGDTTLQLLLPNAGYIAGKKSNLYLDADNSNAPFASALRLQAWTNANLELEIRVAGADMNVGDTVFNSSPYGIFFADANNLLSQSPDLKFDGKLKVGYNLIQANNISVLSTSGNTIGIGLTTTEDESDQYIEFFDDNGALGTGKIKIDASVANGSWTFKNSGIVSVNSDFTEGTYDTTGIALKTNFYVAHGLGQTPSHVDITPLSAGAAILYYCEYLPTVFIVHFISSPGVVDVKFSWRAYK